MSGAPLIAGLHIRNEGRYQKECKQCKATVMMAQLNKTGRPWKAFDAKPVDREIRYYRVHYCPREPETYAERAQRHTGHRPPQQRRLW